MSDKIAHMEALLSALADIFGTTTTNAANRLLVCGIRSVAEFDDFVRDIMND